MKTFMIITLVLVLQTQNSHAATTQVNCKDEASYPIITLADLQTAINAKEPAKKPALIVDVNSNDSFKEASVTGAVHFTKADELAKILPKDKNALIVAYCGGPKCTAWFKAAKVACDAGYTNIQHFKEGISGWKKAKHS